MNILIALLLVAQEGIDSKIDEFARALKGGELETRLRDALLTPAGKTVVKEEMLTAMAKKIASDYFRKRFDDQGRLLESSKDEAAQLVKEFEVCQSDLQELKAAADAVADRIADEPEINAQMKKLLKSEEGLQLLYLAELRQAAGRTNAAEKVIKAHLGKAFVEDPDGKLVLRDEAREKIESMLALADEKLKGVEDLSMRLKEIGAKLPDNGINGRIKKAFESPVAAAIIYSRDPNARVEDAFVEIDGGLSLTAEFQEKAEKLLTICEEAGGRIEALRAMFDSLIERIKDDEAGARLKAALKNDVVRVAIAAKLPRGGSAKSVTEAFQKWFAAVFEERAGVCRVKEALSEEAARRLKKAAQGARIVRKVVALISQEAQKISDAEPVKAVCSSPFAAAKLVEGMIGRGEVLKQAAGKGLEKFVGETFVKEGDGCSIREESRAAVEEFLRKVEEVGKEK